jgi:uncharacterized protein
MNHEAFAAMNQAFVEHLATTAGRRQLRAVPAYLSPKLEVWERSAEVGKGVYAREPLPAGELLAIFGGRLITPQTLARLPLIRRQKSIQVEERSYLMSLRLDEPSDSVNHSCAPNAGLDGPIGLRALREIAAGEEICYDYAMSDGSIYDEFDCCCGAPACRGRITGNDWQQPALQAQYAGWFSPYLQRRIEWLQQTLSVLA